MIFAILNTVEFPVPRTHYLHVKKFSIGFIQNGYSVVEIHKIGDIMSLESSSIIYISNHFYVDINKSLFKGILFKKLKKILKNTKAIPLLWSFHDLPSLEEILNNRPHLYLTENYYDDCIEKYTKLNFYKDKVHHKLTYSSYIDDRINFSDLPWAVEIKYSFNYVGSKYQYNLLNSIRENKKFNSKILFYPPVQNEIIRLNSFASSKINLVFHSNENIDKGIITERFPESLSMGNFIIHDHPRITNEYKSEGLIFTIDLKRIFDYENLIDEGNIKEYSELNYKLWQNTDMSYRKQVKAIISKIKNN